MGWNPWKWGKSFIKSMRQSGFAIALRNALGSGQAGAWASDHRTEAEQFTGWTYVAVRAICSQLMQATVTAYDESQGGARYKTVRKNLYASEEGEAKPLPNDHPLMKILRRPNPTQSGAMFRYECGLQLQLTGTCIIWNVPNAFGKPVQRYVIPTAIASPIQPSTAYPEGGYRISSTASRYAVVDSDGFTTSGIFNQVVGKVIPIQQLQVIRWPHPVVKDDGQSPVSAGAKWIDSANQIDEARWAQMNNGADPSVIVTLGKDSRPTQKELDDAKQKFSQEWNGAASTGKAMFVTGDRVVTPTVTPKDMSYGEGFEQFRDAIMALHGVPGIAAGMAEGGSYSAFYASLKQFIRLTVQPILDLLAEEDTEQLAPFFGKGLIVEMEAAEIDDPEVLNTELSADASAGTITYNEYRAARGRAPIKDGDRLITPPSPMAGPQESGQSQATPFATGKEGPPTRRESKPEEPEMPVATEKPEQPTEQPGDSEDVPAGGKSVQSTALNGAQVASLVDLATAFSTGQLPLETVRKLIEAAFPLMESALIDEILSPLLTFEPSTSDQPPATKSFLSNEEAFQKAHQILRSWNDYPGGQP